MSKNFELLLLAQQESKQAGSTPPTGVNGNGRNAAAEQAGRTASVEQAGGSEPVEHAGMRAPLPQTGSVREQIATLVRHLFLLPQGVHTAVLTGVESGDGNSWITMESARMLAACVPGSVCVVDGNLHSPALHRYFGVPGRRGLRDAISQSASICDSAELVPRCRNLWLITAGAAKVSQAAALEQLCSQVADLRSKFDYVLIDSPSLDSCGDAIMLGRSADGVALVLAEQSTRRERARNAVQELAKANVRILGAVLNKRTFPIPQKIYDRI